MRLELEETAAGASLRHPGGSIDVDPGQVEALAALLDGDAWRVDALPGELEPVADLVRLLLARGIVVPAAV
jgi:hypothetical protein